MKEQIEKAKAHVKRNKNAYIVGAIGVVSVVVTVVVMKGNTPTSLTAMNYNAPKFNWRPENNQMVVNLVERSTPSKPVHLVGTNLFFSSLNEASRETGYSLSAISKNVNGIIPNVNGDVFQLLDKAA